MTRSIQSENKLYIEKIANYSCECINKEEGTAIMTSVSEIAYRL
jgi:hypothetical protein